MIDKLPHPKRYCHCGAKKTFSDPVPGEQATCWQDSLVYMCTRCGYMSHVHQPKEPDVYSPIGATAPLGSTTDGAGISIITWAGSTPGERIVVIDFLPYPRRTPEMRDQGRNHLMNMWAKLDASIDDIRGGQYENVEFLKGTATAYADVLAQLMHQYFADTNAVLAESMARWQARQEGRDHQTPGLAETIWDPALRNVGASGPAVPAKAIPVLGDAQKNFVRHQLGGGLMDAETLASMFEVPVESVKAALEG